MRAQDHDAIYLTSGHGTMCDFANNPDLAKLVAEFYEAGKIVLAVCHGPSGLLNVQPSDGGYLIAGKKVTGFSWREQQLVKRDDALPFSLEDALRGRSADYEKALLPFASHMIEDGWLITGQNPKARTRLAKRWSRGFGLRVIRHRQCESARKCSIRPREPGTPSPKISRPHALDSALCNLRAKHALRSASCRSSRFPVVLSSKAKRAESAKLPWSERSVRPFIPGFS